FERQAVKSVAPDAALFIAPRNGEAARGRRNAVMEGGVETGDLRQRRPDRPHGANRLQTTRLVQRCQRRQCLQPCVDIVRQFDRTEIVWTAVNDAVTDSEQIVLAKMALDEGEHVGEQMTAVG